MTNDGRKSVFSFFLSRNLFIHRECERRAFDRKIVKNPMIKHSTRNLIRDHERQNQKGGSSTVLVQIMYMVLSPIDRSPTFCPRSSLPPLPPSPSSKHIIDPIPRHLLIPIRQRPNPQRQPLQRPRHHHNPTLPALNLPPHRVRQRLRTNRRCQKPRLILHPGRHLRRHHTRTHANGAHAGRGEPTP